MRETERAPVRALVVEDDPGTAGILAALLSAMEDIRVVGTAGDGRQGLALIQSLRPDLVLLDMVMPEMDGLELLRALGETEGQRPYVIALSGVSSDVTIQRALALGAGFYLVKPVNPAALELRIRDRFRREQPPERTGAALARWRLEEMGGGKERELAMTATAAGALAESGETVLKAAYARVRRVHGAEYTRAERTIRRCIAALHAKSSPAYRALLGAEPGEKPPSNGAFLRRLAEKVREDLRG